jgi:hypothetical protein
MAGRRLQIEARELLSGHPPVAPLRDIRMVSMGRLPDPAMEPEAPCVAGCSSGRPGDGGTTKSLPRNLV